MKNLPRWRTVDEFPLYEVCEDGRVRSYRRKSRTWRNPRSGIREEPVILKGTTTPHGYTAFILRGDNGKPTRRTAHRLVALAFLENPKGLTDVAHNDGNPGNNHVSNLRWSTHRDNQLDMRAHGTMQDGEKCITAKLTGKQVEEIRATRAAAGRGSQVRLAKKYGISVAQISRIVNGTRWASTYQGAING